MKIPPAPPLLGALALAVVVVCIGIESYLWDRRPPPSEAPRRLECIKPSQWDLINVGAPDTGTGDRIECGMTKIRFDLFILKLALAERCGVLVATDPGDGTPADYTLRQSAIHINDELMALKLTIADCQLAPEEDERFRGGAAAGPFLRVDDLQGPMHYEPAKPVPVASITLYGVGEVQVKDDITAKEVADLLQLFMAAIANQGLELDYLGYVKAHHLERHFKRSP